MASELGPNVTLEAPSQLQPVETTPTQLQQIAPNEQFTQKKVEDSIKNTQLQKMVQELYMAQGQVNIS